MKKVFLLLTMFLFAFTGVTRANVQQNRADQVIEQGFEDGLGDWTMNHCHSSSGPTSSYGGNTGNYAFRFYYTTNYPQYLISPELDDNDGVNLTFYAARYSSNYPETFKVGYSSTTNDPTEFTWGSEVTCTTMYGAGAYEEYSYDFPAGTKYVAIACTSNDQFYMFVDDITVTATEPAPAPTPGELVEVTIGDPTSTEVSSYIPGYTLYDYAISQQIYTADEIGVAGTIETLTMWLKNNSSYARNINVYMKEVEATEFASNTAWESFAADDMVVSFTMPNGNSTPIEVALPLDNPFEYSGTGNLVICFQDVTGQWSSGLGGVVMDAAGNQAIYAYRDGTVYDPSNPGVNGTLLAKKNVIRLSIMTGGGAQTAFSTIPEVLDLGYRPNGAWMAPYVFNLKSNVGAVTVNALDFSGNYFTYNAELPATISGNNPLEVAVSTGTAEAGEVSSTITVLYGENRDAEQFEITAIAYDPVEGDVVENAIEVEMEAQTEVALTLPDEIYYNYETPNNEQEAADAVYKVTFDEDAILYAGGDGNITVYTEDFNGQAGPMVDNNYEYNGPVVNPGPTALWFSYPYTGSNTWYGTSAGGGFYFGYKISTDLIAANGLAGLTITQVEAAAREAYPYYCYIIEGGATPFDGNQIGGGFIENTTALYFFDINLNMPAYISGNADIWVIFYSDSPYAAYCGRYPVSTANGKIWTYNPNASSPMWSSNTTYTPVIYCRMLELPTGREVSMDLAKMEVKKGNGVASEIAETEGSVMNVAKANMRNRDVQTLTVHDGSATNGNVPFYGFYGDAYLKCEMVYPAAELADMAGGTINSMTFYASQTSVSWGNANQQVFVTEVADASISEFAGPGTVVFEGALSIVNGEMVVNFTTPYTYNGGNLLVGVYNTATGSYVTSTWYGETVSGASVQNYNYSSLSAITPIQKDFLPKTTFAYESSTPEPPTPPTPEPFDPSFEVLFEGMVPAGTYYIVATGTELNLAYDYVPAPEQAVVIAPYDGESNVVAPYLAEWELGDYTTEMQILLGTQYPPQTALIDWTDYLVESAFITELEPNQTYFFQVNERNATGTTMGEVIAFTTPIDPVEGFEVESAELYPGDAAVFTWEANRAFKGYNLYMDGVKVNESLITTNTYAVEDLEYNMEGYAFQVSAVYDAGESELSEAIMVYMTGFGTVSGHVYDAPEYDPEDPDQSHPVAGILVTAIVLDEYQQTHTYEFVTDEEGFYTGDVLATTMCVLGISEENAVTYGYAVATIEGIYVPVAYEEVVEGLDIYTHEYYYPLSMITATEEENDVLVEWSWTPAEMIVDFETGDFSQAEFTLPTSYPWAITTSNVHEGTYAMKSTCEGQASTSSTIEATVEVPYDAKMGFWVKVSSETNYDKFHFYIDGVEQGQALSGALNYQYKEYTVAAGTHTYKWEYAKDSSVNSNDDCVYVDDITMYRQDIPVPPTPGATVYDFEDQTMMGWTSLDANGDGYGWVSSADPGQYHNSGVTLAGTGHNASQGYVLSGSYSNSAGIAITPDNYLVTPTQIAAQAGASISFFACAQDASYAAEHFGVAVATGSAVAANFTTVQEWTLTAKNGYAAEANRGVRGTTAQGNWYEYNVDLSAYAGQDIWVAIRHFNCNDQFILNIDDITVNDGSAKGMTRDNRTLMSYNLYRRDIQHGEDNAQPVMIAEGLASDVMSYTDNEWNTLGYGEYQWGIQATYDGYATESTRDVLFTDNFEDGALTNWTTVDADGDGDTWQNATPASYGIGDAHSGTNCASSWSWNSYTMYPDNWMISPMVEGATNIQYYVATNTAYPDHYGIYASSTGTATSNFTLVFEETAGSKGGNGTRSSMTQAGTRAMSDWMEKNVDLPEGTKYVAFRHWNSDDMNYLFIDDVTINGSSAPVPPTPGPTGDGLSDIIWSNMIPKAMEATLTFNVSLNNGQSPDGAVVTADGGEYTFTATVADGTAELEVRKGVTYDITVSLDGYAPYANEQVLVEADATYDVVLIEIIGTVEGLYVSPTGFVKWDGASGGGVTPPTPPTPPTGNTSFTEGFEGGLNGWTGIVVNAGEGEWIHSSDNLGGYDYTELAHGGTGFAMCYSYVDYVGAFNTDAYLVTPQKYDIVAGSTLAFFADNANDSYPENFSVCVATADNPTAADFTQVWSGGAKGKGGNDVVRHSNNRYENWRAHEIDLSAYAGQSVYIAFHDVNYDQYEIWIDDVTLGVANKGDRAPLSYKVMLDGKYDGETAANGFQHNTDSFEEGSVHTTAVAPLYATGMGDWTTYTWTYTSCEPFAGATEFTGTVNAQTGEVALTWTLPNGTPGPNPPVTPTTETYDFESGMQGWTSLDADGDGFGWNLSSTTMGTGYGHNGSTDMVFSQSYDNSYGVLYPDNYLVSPAKAAYTSISFFACAQDASYAAEHFGVAVSTGNATASEFTMVQEWTMSAKESGVMAPGRDGQTRAQGTWYEKTVDLSAYAGQEIWVAIRHFNCSDMFYLDVDDVTLAAASKGTRAMWDLVGSFQGTSAGQQAVATDGNYIYTASWQSTPTGGHTFYQYTMDGTFVEGFEITGATGIRDLTTDGEYFYGTSGGTQIFCMDFTTRTLVSTINCSGLTSRHISYDPERDGFWSGNWSTLALYSRTGALIQNGPAPTSAYGSAYYKDSDNVEHLFLFCQPNSDCKVYDYNITTGTLGSDVVLDYSNVAPGCTGIAGGCFIGDYNGNTCWFGNSQQDPNLIAIFELESGTGPVPPTPPVPGEGVLGAALFRDGDLIGIFETNVTSYTDVIEESGVYTYTLRVVYDGEPNVTYYATSCGDVFEATMPLAVVDTDEVVNAIYPNPTSSALNIKAQAMTHVTVFNAMGQMVYDQAVNADEMIINMGQYEAGVYMVRIDTENGSSVKRITVVK